MTIADPKNVSTFQISRHLYPNWILYVVHIQLMSNGDFNERSNIKTLI